jgi:hypothetical protein
MVWPISAKLSRSPKLPGVTPRMYVITGTCSRV